LLPLKSGRDQDDDDNDDDDDDENDDRVRGYIYSSGYNRLNASQTPKLDYNPPEDDSTPFLTRRYRDQYDNYQETGQIWPRGSLDGLPRKELELSHTPGQTVPSTSQTVPSTGQTENTVPITTRFLRSNDPSYRNAQSEPRTSWGRDSIYNCKEGNLQHASHQILHIYVICSFY